MTDVVIVTALAGGNETELSAALRAVALGNAVDPPRVVILHTGIGPRAVEELVLSYPYLDFSLAEPAFYQQFLRATSRSWVTEAEQLEAVMSAAQGRVAFIPPKLLSAEAIRLVGDATSPTPGGAPGSADSARIWESAAVPALFWERFTELAEQRRGESPWALADRILRQSGAGIDTVRLPKPVAGPSHDEFLDQFLALEAASPELRAYYAAQRSHPGRGVGTDVASPARTAREMAKAGRAEEARLLALSALRSAGGIPTDLVMALSSAYRSASRYAQARNVLVLARQGVDATSAALAEEADIAWIEHDYQRARELAVRSLRADLNNRKAETVRGRAELPYTRAEDLPGLSVVPDGEPRPTYAHVAFYVSAKGNFGDVALPVTVREAVSTVAGAANWLSVHAHQVFDEERLELVNQTDGIVIGGGGLFLPDTATNSNSGWQWNVNRQLLDRIKVPIGVMTVGYNLFPGQSFHGDLFKSSVVRLVERSTVFGLRNRGSVARVQELLPAELTDRVTFMPCTTTVLNHVRRFDTAPRTDSGIVLINAAFDRSERRFGQKYDVFLKQMADYVTALRSAGVDVRFASHLPADERLVDDLAAAHEIRLPVHALYDMTLDEGYELYRSVSLVVGMRGHATMIPFGLGTPVLSLISHPKMRYFLEDIGRPEWGFDIFEENLSARLEERTLDIVRNEGRYRTDVEGLQLDLLEPVRVTVEQFHGTSG